MKVHQMLICIFILSLQDGNTGLINTETITVKEGGNITHGCSFSFSGSRKIFCKEGCEEKDILVETTGDRAQRGRYSIEWKKAADIFTSPVLYVSITNLTKSDSGRYTCRLDRGYLANKEFEIRVEDAPITEPIRPLPPRPPSVPSTSTPTTTQSLNVVPGTLITEPTRPLSPRPPSVPSTTQSLNVAPGSSTPSSASTDTSSQSGQRQRTAGPGVLLYVGLSLVFMVIMVIMLSVAVVIFCRWRASKPKGPPEEPEYDNVTEASREYEEIREDRERSSPPVEISAVYTCAKYVKPDAEDTKENDSAGATCEKKTKVDSNKLAYSEVDFSNPTAASLNSAPRGDADNVVYSVSRGAPSDGNQGGDASPPLYSTVTLPRV